MRDADSGVCRVDRLAAGPRRAECVDPKVVLIDLDVDLFGLGQDGDRYRRRMNTSARFRLRDALDAVHAALEAHFRVNIVALDDGNSVLNTADARVGFLQDV